MAGKPYFSIITKIGVENYLEQRELELGQAAGISDATSHSDRCTGLTNLAERGVGVRTLMALAGHSNMATTQRYIDLRPAMLKAAVELV